MRDKNKEEVKPQVFSDIIKSEEDSRSYRGLQLANEMKVLLVSDPTTDKSAASLNVNIGYMCDPTELPGLAHFCEHMLFLGTKKYPEENEYSRFLNQHGGSSNAFTGGDHTNFYFDVSPTFLKPTLDRFAQFFICPLFTESATFREINAVHSEHEKNLQNDTWRLNQLQKSTGNPAHDYSKFGTGNLDTLDLSPKSEGINIREELLKFHSKHYSSNIMALAVIGKETLDDLTEMVVSLFSGVQNKNVSIPEWKEHPFDPEHLKLKGYIVPVKDIRTVNVTFPLPDYHQHYRSNPGHYLGHLVGHEGPGSILSELKARGWANNLIGGYKAGARGFAFFILTVELTEEGIDHTDDIVTLLFQYLNMLKTVGPQQWIFEECQNVCAMHFRFRDRERSQTYASNLAGLMHLFPFEELLCGPFLLQEYKPELILELQELLTPQNLRIAIVGKKFEAVADQVEEWYGTKYKLEVIPDSLLNEWSNSGTNENLKLPPPNEFMPTNFQLVEREPAYHKVPVLIKNSEMSRLWFKQDDDFKLPKAVLSFQLESPLAYMDPHHYNALYLFVELFKDSITEYAYSAELADLAYNLSQTKFGVFLYVKGYNDKHGIFLKKIVEKLTSFQVDKKRFKSLKETYIRTLKNFKAEQPHQHAIYHTSMLLSERVWSNEELIEFATEITAEQVQKFIPCFLSRIHIESLIYGNYTKEQALSLLSVVEDKLRGSVNSNPLLPSQMMRYREHQLCDGCHYVYEVSNDVHRCSAIEAYYQCGVQETRLNMLLEIFCQVITEPCYNVLRIQEQLGYIVFSGARRSHGVQGLRIIVQSDKPPSYVDSRIEAFLQSVDKLLQDMPEKEFESHKLALATQRLEKPKKMDNQTAKYWTEIITHQYNFDRDNIEVICLRTITKDELYLFFKEQISFDAPRRKKMSIYVISSVLEENEESSEEVFVCATNDALPKEIDGLIPPPPAFRPPLKVENVTEFKSGLGLYPLAKPWINIPPPVNHTSKSKL